MKESAVIKRLKAEVKKKTAVSNYDRVHNRHNRAGN